MSRIIDYYIVSQVEIFLIFESENIPITIMRIFDF